MEPTESSLVSDLLPIALQVVLTGLFTLAGVVLGWFAARGRERREVRRAVYVEWLAAAWLIGTWPKDAKLPRLVAWGLRYFSKAEEPDEVWKVISHLVIHPIAIRRLDEATAAVRLIASDEVIEAVRQYLDLVPQARESAKKKGVLSLHEATEAIDLFLEAQRDLVAKLMRSDLKSRR